MEREYISSLPNGFYNPISSPIKTMSLLKKQIMDKSVRPVTKVESNFLCLLMIEQQREIKTEHLFAYEMCAVSS